MMLSRKQKTILSYFRNNMNAEFTTQQAIELLRAAGQYGYYCNGRKHVGALLGRMVKRGLLVRVKKGLFKRGQSSIKRSVTNLNQTVLF